MEAAEVACRHVEHVNDDTPRQIHVIVLDRFYPDDERERSGGNYELMDHTEEKKSFFL